MEFLKFIFSTLVIYEFLIIITLTKTIEDGTKKISEEFRPTDISLLSIKKDTATEKDSKLLRKIRESRCIRCYEERIPDDPGRSGYGYGSNRYYGSSGRGYHDERPPIPPPPPSSSSWYYYPDRYDPYSSRGKYDQRYPDQYGSRNDDRYYPRTYDTYEHNRYMYYDRCDPRLPLECIRGYDSRDRYYDQPPPRHGGDGYLPRDQYYDRPRGGGYDDGRNYYYGKTPYDRNPPRGTGGYDYKNYRPWDETYRGQSGFDNSGRGYYFANRPNELHHQSIPLPPPPPPPPSNYKPSSGDGYGQPYLPHSQSPPRPIQSLPPNSSSNIQPQSPSYSSSSPSSSSQPSYSSSNSLSGQSSASFYHHSPNNRPQSRPDDDSSQGYAGGWSYVSDREKPSNYDDRDKNIQSSPYGPRPRPLGGSYLYDRDSNVVVPKNDENKVGNQSNNQQKQSINQHQQQSDKIGGSGPSSINNTTDGRNTNSIDGDNKMTN